MNENLSDKDASEDQPKPVMNAKQFFDILRAKGPSLDRVGKSFVIVSAGQTSNSEKPADEVTSDNSSHPNGAPPLEDDDFDEPLSGSRRLRQLRAEISKEFTDRRDKQS
jgi:hypothetical protein